MSNDTINRKEAEVIQYVLWALTDTKNPMEAITFYLKEWNDTDIRALWSKFITARHIDWVTDPSPTNDTEQAKVLV